jgi:hypothetical protein
MILGIFINKERFVFHFSLFQIIFFYCIFPLYSNPDLTIVGYVMVKDGLGKIPVTILETLGSDISANISHTRCCGAGEEKLPLNVIAALDNPDQSAGKIALFTDALWDVRLNNEVRVPKDSIVKLAYSMFETTRIPSKWVKILNEEFDAVIVPDQFYIGVYENCGVEIPIFVLPIPMMLDPYFAHSIRPKSPSTPFIFGDASANKNPSALVEGFAKAFGNNPSVQLVMRACWISNETREIINRLLSQYGLTNVTLEEGGASTTSQFIDRLASFDCYVNLSRGEGFSLIPREALAMGTPVIITDNTASSTICASGFVYPVKSVNRVAPLPHYNAVFGECGEQFDCEVKDVAAALLAVYGDYDKYIKKARKGRKWVNQYNCTNSSLRNQYQTLIKPKQVKLGNRNKIQNGIIITKSKKLYKKYKQVVDSNQ